MRVGKKDRGEKDKETNREKAKSTLPIQPICSIAPIQSNSLS